MSPILIISIIWIISEIILARKKASVKGSGKYDKSSLRIMWGTIVVFITVGIFVAQQETGRIMQYRPMVHYMGLCLIVIGVAVRWIAIIKLDKYFTVDVTIQKDQQIIDTGIYKFIRHPAYSGSLLSFAGLGIATVNWLSFIIMFIPILASFLYRINIEEKVLLSAFGTLYSDYAKITKRLIPWIY